MLVFQVTTVSDLGDADTEIQATLAALLDHASDLKLFFLAVNALVIEVPANTLSPKETHASQNPLGGGDGGGQRVGHQQLRGTYLPRYG